MSTAPVPAYPVIHVNVAVDGSAHVNVAGRHEHFNPAPGDDTRRAVTAYAATIATELHRPLRMNITDPDGQWLVAVHPNGTVTELTDPVQKPRRTRPPADNATADRPAARTAEISEPRVTPAPLAPDLEQTHIAHRKPTPLPTATIHFSTGDIARITGTALIGRRPHVAPDEEADLTVTINDPSRVLSRTHLRVEWHDGALWATDRASANGTTIERAGAAPIPLIPWQPFQLQSFDVIVIGDVHATVSDIDQGRR